MPIAFPVHAATSFKEPASIRHGRHCALLRPRAIRPARLEDAQVLARPPGMPHLERLGQLDDRASARGKARQNLPAASGSAGAANVQLN